MRGSKLLASLAALAAAWSMWAAPSRGADFVEYDLKIEPQSLGAALQEFSKQSGLQVVFLSKVTDGIEAPAVKGKFTADRALRRLLDQSPLMFRELNSNTIEVQRREKTEASTSSVLPEKEGLVMRLAQSASADTPASTPSAQSSEVRDGSGKIEEIVVTAQKREEGIRDVPASITAIKGQTLERRQLTDVQSLSFAVPGLTAYDSGGGRLSIAIRGIDNTVGSTSLTGVYMDEVPLAGSQGGFTPMYMDVRGVDLERVEVLKGPQGTLFGEGAVGGVIRYVTNKPDLTDIGGRVSLTGFGTEDGDFGKQGTAVFNLPIVKDVLGVRLAGTYEDNGGWIDNVGTGEKDFNDSKLANVRLMTLWQPTSDLSITGFAQVHRNHGGGGNIVDLKPYESSSFIQAVDRNLTTAFDTDYQIYNLSLNYDLGFASLISSTSYWDIDSVASFTQYFSGTPPVGSAFGFTEIATPFSTQGQNVASQEVRLVSSSAGPFKWVAGAQYKNDKFHNTMRNASAKINYGAITVNSAQNGLLTNFRSESWAAFGDAAYTFMDRLEIGGGLRHYIDDREISDSRGYARANTFRKLTYRAYTRYAASDNVNLYLNVSTGFRSGGFTPSTAAAQGGPPTYDPENAIFYEAGVKTRLLEGRAGVNIAVFEGKYEDQLQAFSSATPSGQVISYTANVGDARIRGLEWQFDFIPLERLTLGFGGDVLRTKFTKASSIALVFVGDPLPRTPDYILQFSANYALRWAEFVPGDIDISYSRKGKAEAINRLNTLGARQATSRPLDMLQVSLGADWKGLAFTLFGRNLLDERDPLLPSVLDSVEQARPRSFGVTVSKAF